MTKQKQFLDRVAALLLDMGAEQDKDRFTLQTKVGRLNVHPSEEHTGLGTVYARFDDPKAAWELVDCNRYSGKWNFHFFDGWTVEKAIAELSFWLRRMMP